ncbi:MAG: metallophosphoesterase [Myxococcota bacterium]|nr:metallophosphoesterase [Myxococcota bacterium]
MSLIETLPSGPLAIIGDVHGEFDELVALLEHREVGYRDVLARRRAGQPLVRGARPERTLIFVGDLVDRGPDSPSVVDLVLDLMDAGLARCIIGNHELNLLRGDNDQRGRPGTGWFSGRPDSFQLVKGGRHHDFRCAEATTEQCARFRERLNVLPLAGERDDLRVVHACWQEEGIEKLRKADYDGIQGVTEAYEYFHQQMQQDQDYLALLTLAKEEIAPYEAQLRNRSVPPPPMGEVGNWLLAGVREQNDNPVKVLTSGPEQIAQSEPIFKERWRLHERERWWNHYSGTPVVLGHYWRSTTPQRRGLWDGMDPFCWIGETGRVFCVDYSVGRRYKDRVDPPPQSPATDLGLAAMLWPETTTALEPDWSGPTLVFADGHSTPIKTPGFGGYDGAL